MADAENLYHPDTYDALCAPTWRGLAAVVTALLAPAADAPGLVVDLGAGTGLSTVVLAEAAPASEVLACEPFAGLRACLLTRIACLELGDRVTATELDAARLVVEVDEPVAMLGAFHMLGNLDAGTRRGLWGWLAAHLAPGGRAVVGPFAEHAVTETQPEEEVYARETVGRRTYEGLSRAELTDTGEARWHMGWRIWEGDRLVDERRATHAWESLTAGAVAAEVEAAGLTAERHDDLLVIRR